MKKALQDYYALIKFISFHSLIYKALFLAIFILLSNQLIAQDYAYKRQITQGDVPFLNPLDVAVDNQGNIYMGDHNKKVQKFDSNGNFILSFSSVGYNEEGEIHPKRIEVDPDGNIYVLNEAESEVIKFNSEGVYIFRLATLQNGGPLHSPQAISTDNSGGLHVLQNNYISGNTEILKFDASGILLEKYILSVPNLYLYSTNGIAVDSNSNYYVSDPDYRSIFKFNPLGQYEKTVVKQDTEESNFNHPSNVTLDKDGNIFLPDHTTNSVYKYDPEGNLIQKIGGFGYDPGQLRFPMGATLDKNNILYVADSQNNRIQIFAPLVPDIQVIHGSILVEEDETINFNDVDLFANSSKTFTIKNIGIINLELPDYGSIEVTGDNASDFVLDASSCENSIAPSNSTNFNLTFSPTSEGLRSAKIIIHSNDPDNSTFSFNVVGHGKKLEQQITFGALPEKTVEDPSFSLNATSTSGLTISYNSSNPLVATVSGNIITIVGEGTSTITANQSGNVNYLPAIEVAQILTVVSQTPIALTPVIENFSPSSGSIGTTVTINGDNFKDVTEVNIDGVTSIFNINSSTQITAIVPQGTTGGKIYITSVEGTAVSSSEFIVTYPKPSISSFSPSSGGAGTIVTIYGTNFYGTTSVKFGNSEANSFEVKSSSIISAIVPSNAQSNLISVTTPGGTAKSKSKFQFLKSSTRPTGEKSITEQKTLLVYPNPFKSSFTLRINSSELSSLEIYVFDLQGRAMFSSSENTTNMDIVIGKDLKKGIYIVKIIHEEQLQVFKLIKEED